MKSDLSFHYFKVLSSTNDKAMEFVKKGKSNLVIVAEKQEKGRGRFGRRWDSQIGGLYMTILLEENDLDKARYFTFMASISVAKAINKLGLNAKVKWPNDVLIDDKKLCGILTEIVCKQPSVRDRGSFSHPPPLNPTTGDYALVGIGVNINQKQFPAGIKNKATSLKIELNKNYNIKNISKMIIKEFNNLYHYYNIKNYGKIIDIWKKYSHTLGKMIKARTLSGNYTGKAINIDKDCNLLLKLNNGNIKKIVEGDIFVV